MTIPDVASADNSTEDSFSLSKTATKKSAGPEPYIEKTVSNPEDSESAPSFISVYWLHTNPETDNDYKVLENQKPEYSIKIGNKTDAQKDFTGIALDDLANITAQSTFSGEPKIKEGEPGELNYNKDTKRLVWKGTLKPGETSTINYTADVTSGEFKNGSQPEMKNTAFIPLDENATLKDSDPQLTVDLPRFGPPQLPSPPNQK